MNRTHATSRFPVAGALLLALVPLQTVAGNAIAEAAKRPVPVTLVATSNRALELVGLVDGELELRPPGDTSGAAILIPLADMGKTRLRFQYPSDYDAARELIDDGFHAEALEMLRPTALTLSHYLAVPNEHFNIHEYVKTFTTGLVRAGVSPETTRFLRHLPLDHLDTGFLDLVLQYAGLLIATDRRTDALALLGDIPVDADASPVLARLTRFASALRQEGNLAEALFLYQRVNAAGDSAFQLRSALWTAYCNIRLDRVATAQAFLDELPSLERDQPEFSLRRLIETRIHLRQDNLPAASEAVSQGVVFSRVSHDWAPELRYLAGICYQRQDRPTVAQAVFEEVRLFYPENPWASAAAEQLPAGASPGPPARPETIPLDPGDPGT